MKQNLNNITFIDFCSGIGGGRLGLELNGFKCLGFSEIDKEAIKTYKNFFDCKKELELGDLTKISPLNLPDFDLLISGFPCQSFSIVGKREGLENKDKGQIIYYLAEILKVKQPKFFILENVKGLISHEKGKTLKIILEILNECNYNVFWQVFNSLEFGLAQSRERIYFVGIRKNLKQDFDIQKLKFDREKKANIKDFLMPTNENIFNEKSESFNTFLKYLQNKYNTKKFPKIKLDDLLKRDYLVLDTRQSDLRIYENKIPTLRRDRQGLLYVFKGNLYRLSGLEALNFQGFSKISNLKEKIKDLRQSDILRQCGNAMSVNVIERLANKLKECNG
ncbi:MAG: DNA (cytosine-5-)-methyltransferase [Campylobacter hyointestinalis]|uniref:DNA (cytosine-5-)-methyltransferase n=1 Tax=Campylobacter hyointestinalis TaxID=198 RepID=UPI0007C99B98|nr:DNA (cytosine-5-)-methyltransferase [Campylobacter hyointestinalis]ANE35098.1 cytosine-specific DNA methyltransferase [Campylobacter hyointestinalis subsp. lawsonii CCUG 27631]